jgi:hypothetical protein
MFARNHETADFQPPVLAQEAMARRSFKANQVPF